MKIRAGLVIIFSCVFCHLARAGYDLHITRAKDWTESRQTPVTVEEWIQVASSDGEFRVVQPEDSKEKPRDAVWICPTDKREVYFYYSEGEITVKNPDETVIAKIKRLAAKLKAKVVGDEGEEFK